MILEPGLGSLRRPVRTCRSAASTLEISVSSFLGFSQLERVPGRQFRRGPELRDLRPELCQFEIVVRLSAFPCPFQIGDPLAQELRRVLLRVPSRVRDLAAELLDVDGG